MRTSPPSTFTVEQLDEGQAKLALPELVGLLQDAVASGASLGFMPPLSADEARSYWHEVFDGLCKHSRILLAVRREQQIVGSVQLDLVLRKNGLHRAEVQKLMVHRKFRRQGLGRALMTAVEEAARQAGRTLLVLDTRKGDPSE
jgi:ribosomal protein S18 acetylase RimI-like enzyme